MAPSTASVPGESSNRSLPLWHFAYSSSVSLFLVWPQYFLNPCLLCQVSEQVSVHKPFKSEVYFFPSTQALLKVGPFGFQRQTLTGLIFLMQVPRAGVHDVGLELLLLQRGLCLYDTSLLLVGGYTGDMGPDLTSSLFLLPILIIFFFHYVLSCRRAFLLVLRSFSEFFQKQQQSWYVSVGRGGVRIFLLHHLDPASELIFNTPGKMKFSSDLTHMYKK